MNVRDLIAQEEAKGAPQVSPVLEREPGSVWSPPGPPPMGWRLWERLFDGVAPNYDQAFARSGGAGKMHLDPGYLKEACQIAKRHKRPEWDDAIGLECGRPIPPDQGYSHGAIGAAKLTYRLPDAEGGGQVVEAIMSIHTAEEARRL